MFSLKYLTVNNGIKLRKQNFLRQILNIHPQSSLKLMEGWDSLTLGLCDSCKLSPQLCSVLKWVSLLCFDSNEKLLGAFSHWFITYSALSHNTYKEIDARLWWIENGRHGALSRNTEYSLRYLAPDCYSSLCMFFMIVTYTMLRFVFVAIKNNLSRFYNIFPKGSFVLEA